MTQIETIRGSSNPTSLRIRTQKPSFANILLRGRQRISNDMAEAVGLAVGIIGLAATFKTCVDLFDYISASRKLGVDYELLETKLEVEKTLLLQWATRVGLLAEPPDARLDHFEVRHAVSRVLRGIQLLLSDSKTLQDRYGMRAVTESIDHTLQDGSSPKTQILGQRRMATFINDFRELRLRTAELQKAVPTSDKIRWAIHDKGKFEGLIDQLSYFVSRLNEIVPDCAGKLELIMHDDLRQLHGNALQRIILACQGREELMAASAEKVIISRLQKLFWYRAMHDRRSSVTAAHSQTFEWALQSSSLDTQSHWDDVCDWLEHGSGIYWISGKAGSGKSTLMKYLHGHPTTSQCLEAWAGSTRLTKASFFFFALGTNEQKSQDGLIRALFYQIFEAKPELIETLFPELWQEAHMSEEVSSLPSRGEVKKAFDIIREGVQLDHKFCFFIDGLDEFDGNYSEAIQFIESLAANPQIKVMVSSRPIPSCVQAFSRRPKLQLQDLTNGDITRYVERTIGSHPHMMELGELYADTEEVNPATQIITELISKASGVFLWVILACRSLEEGFAAYDNIGELRKRVNELPPELEDLFQHMLDRIDPRYHSEAAKILRICYRNQLDDVKRLPSVGLAIADELGMNPRRVQTRKLSEAEKRATCQFLEGRLRSRCWGLLEISRPSSESVEFDCFCKAGGLLHLDTHNWLIDSHVQFMHRTVFDFLSQPGIWGNKCLQVQDVDFDADAVLSWIFAELLGLCGQRHIRKNWKYLKHAMVHALQADSRATGTIVPVFSRLDQILQTMLREKPADIVFAPELSDLFDDYKHRFPFSLLLATELGMVNYVRSCLNTVNFFQNRPQTMLYHALQCPYLNCLESWEHNPSTTMVKFLLSTGSNPNAEISRKRGASMTPWKYWRLQMASFRKVNLQMEAVEVTNELLNAGAQVDAGREFSKRALVEIVKEYYVEYNNPHEAENEVKKLREKGLELLQTIEDCRTQLELGEDIQGESPNAAVVAGAKRPGDMSHDSLTKRLKPDDGSS